jgi:hypothetical protein
LNKFVGDALVAVAIGLALFAALLVLQAGTPLLAGIPIGVAAVWFIAQSVRRSKRSEEQL